MNDLQRNAWKYALLAAGGSRLVTTIWVAILAMFLPSNAVAGDGYEPLPAAMSAGTQIERILLEPWYRWDSIHYLKIAVYGYAADLQNAVWPPLYPLLTRFFDVFSPSPLLAGLVVSLLALTAAFYGLYCLLSEDFDEAIARRVLFLMTIFPTAFFLQAVYTEALFLLLAVGVLWALRQKRWWLAGGLAAIGALSRNQGLTLVCVLAWEAGRTAWQERPLRPALALRFIPAGLPVLAWGGYVLFAHYGLGAPWYWQLVGRVWQERFGLPWQGLIGNIVALVQYIQGYPIPLGTTLFDLGLGLLGLGMMIAMTRRVPAAYLAYAWPLLLSALMKMTEGNLLLSVSRYAILWLPLFIGQALLWRNRWGQMAWFAFAVGSQILFLSIFYLGYWVG